MTRAERIKRAKLIREFKAEGLSNPGIIRRVKQQGYDIDHTTINSVLSSQRERERYRKLTEALDAALSKRGGDSSLE